MRRLLRSAINLLLLFSAACGPLVIPVDDASVDADVDGGSADAATRFVHVRVEKQGDGTGNINSMPGAIACGTACEADLPAGTSLTLTAEPDGNTVFRGWSGPCTGRGRCTVNLDEDTIISADFGSGAYTLTVTLGGEGLGSLVSSPEGIDCGDRCTANFAAEDVATLTAAPIGSSTFAGWSGACSGAAAVCTVTMNQARTVEARFNTPGRIPRFNTIVDLGALPGGATNWATTNDSGWTAGWGVDGSNRQRAFRASPDGAMIVDLGTLGGDRSSVWDINASGWIVGQSRNGDGVGRALLCPPQPSTDLQDLGTLGGAEGTALGINASNWIVGNAMIANGDRHAFRRSPSGTMIDLGTLGGTYSSAGKINASGWAVGDSTLSDGRHHAFRVPPDPVRTLEDLGTLGGPDSFAYAINDDGAVVGFASTSGNAMHAFYVEPPPARSLADIGTLGGLNSYAYAVNSSGRIVGKAENDGGVTRAFVWDPSSRVLVDLNELLPRGTTNWELQSANDVTDDGSIVGVGLIHGTQHAFRLVP